MTNEETTQPQAETTTPETKTAAPIPPKRIPLPPVKQGFHNINNVRGGGNFKGGNKVGTKIMKHSSKGR